MDDNVVSSKVHPAFSNTVLEYKRSTIASPLLRHARDCVTTMSPLVAVFFRRLSSMVTLKN